MQLRLRRDRRWFKPASGRSRPGQLVSPKPLNAVTSGLNAVRNGVMNVGSAISDPSVTPSPRTQPRASSFLAALFEAARRNVFNTAPVVTDVDIKPQGANGVITGDIDAKDPDELGTKVQIRSTVQAAASSPAECGCEQVPGLIALAYTNPAVLGGNPGDNWHAPDAVDKTTVYLNPDYTLAYYAVNEPGNVTITGLGSGYVVLNGVGNLTDGGAGETTVATWCRSLGRAT